MTDKTFTREETPDFVRHAVPTELMPPSRLIELASQWEDDAQWLAQYGAPNHAELLRHCSQKLFAAMQGERDTLLTLKAAAEMSGYSEDHLGKMVRQKKLTNYGRKHSPKVRLAELPKKSMPVVIGKASKYDVNADALSILSRGRRVS